MSEIKRAVEMAKALLSARAAVEQKEMELSLSKEAVRKIEQEDLPELMQELELEEFKMEDGSRVSVMKDITCGISEANKRQAHGWLVSNEFGGIIKTEVKVPFEAGKLDEAGEFAAENGGELKEFVHPMTLKSFLKERLEAGTALPTEAFGIRAFNRVKIELPKVKK